MKKILFVVNDADFFISHRLPIAKFLIENGYEVHLATSGETLPIYNEIGLSFHKLEVTRKGMSPVHELKLVFQIYKLFTRLKPDLVHLVTIKPYLYGGIVASLTKVPAVVSAISGLGFDFMSSGTKAKFLRALLYPFYKFAFRHKNQLVIFQNEDDAGFLVNWGFNRGVINSSKVRLVRGSGVDLQMHQYSSEPQGKVIITFVARLLVDKGIREFIEASKILHDNGIEATFWIVGDIDEGNQKSITREEIASWKQLPNVKFFGFQENIADFYSKSNIACLPSYREGLPKSLVEAAACGRAVVTTDVPGCRDAIKVNKTGLLVPINNAGALAEGIEYLIDNPDVRKRMGIAGRALAEKDFAIEKIVSDHMKIYRKLLGAELLASRKLLFVVNVDWFFLSHRLPIALEAMRQGYEVHIATALTDQLDVLKNYGFVVHPLTLNRSGVGLWAIGKPFWQIFRVCKIIKPDVVHFVTIKPVLLGGVAARLARVPAIVSAVSGLGFVFVSKGINAVIRRWVVKHLYRMALGHVNLRVIFQNSNDLSSLSSLVELPDKKVTMIRGSGADLSQYCVTPLPKVFQWFCWQPVCWLTREYVSLFNLPRYSESEVIFKDVRFVVVGKPDLDNPHSLHPDELAQWTDEGSVELWGHRTDMPQVMAAAHVVVLPSYYGEGLPKVLIEAAACGRAVVTTDHPGCRDAIEAGVTGLLVPVRNAEALANAIEKLLSNPNRCAEMGKAGRVLAESAFDEKQVVAAHLQIYQELTQN